jgi:electron transport complex protein RnfG
MDIIASDQSATVRPWPLYRALVGVAVGCGLLIVLVFLATAPVIEARRAAALERAILQVLPGAVRHRALPFEPVVYAGLAADGSLVGFAVPAQAMGYQDVIRILYGYDPQRQQIVGLRVLESRETPGLGDKIETDPAFTANFEALDVALGPGAVTILHPIELVKPGAGTEAWQIDGIAGATVSSAAVVRMLAASTAAWVPRLNRDRDQLLQALEATDER